MVKYEFNSIKNDTNKCENSIIALDVLYAYDIDTNASIINKDTHTIGIDKLRLKYPFL